MCCYCKGENIVSTKFVNIILFKFLSMSSVNCSLIIFSCYIRFLNVSRTPPKFFVSLPLGYYLFLLKIGGVTRENFVTVKIFNSLCFIRALETASSFSAAYFSKTLRSEDEHKFHLLFKNLINCNRILIIIKFMYELSEYFNERPGEAC